jgi:hypothetical protein
MIRTSSAGFRRGTASDNGIESVIDRAASCANEAVSD